jgi:hypothetical protein
MRAPTPLFRLILVLRQFLNFKSATIKVGASRSVAHPQNAFVEFSNAAHSNYFLGYDLSRALNVWADYTDPRHNRTLCGLMNSVISNAKSFAKLTKDYGIGLAQSTNTWVYFVANRSA